MLAAGGLFEGGYFDEPSISDQPPDHGSGDLHPPHHDSDDDFGGPPSIASSGGPPSPLQPEDHDKDLFNQLGTRKEPEPDRIEALQNEEGSFALAPVETPVARGMRRVVV